ncbi:type VI secretion system protein ImpA [Chitinivorax tropicus]|uniref:Type VI secretion system protein ImpA n=1 Tax=Chitinivorax tropicus TaxID=714531 RepID=A0A840MSK2_9PROT|nr:type VI secretion system protein TssA [Chitinivorax tropicus]MBB5020147.1 type VI secretion system protein ImpA [Chitinivorax tropicus]
MGFIDLEVLLGDVSADSPSGDNLEYDPVFVELEQAAQGKPEVQYGNTISPAEPPDWKNVKQLALDLLARCRDLRVAVHLARALLHLNGYKGFAEAVHLLTGWLDTRWDSLHPQLDPDDDNDPMLRVNTLALLIDGDFLRELREVPLITSRANGRVSLRDLDILTGELEVPEGVEKPAMGVVEAACEDVGADEVAAIHTALQQIQTDVARLEATLTAQVGASQALDLSSLSRMIKRALNFFAGRVVNPITQVMTEVPLAGDPALDSQTAVVAAPGISGEVRNRDDVLKVLDGLCDYYAKHEPSSPVPLLLRRAYRLATMDFLEIMQELAPDGISQVRQVSGTQD